MFANAWANAIPESLDNRTSDIIDGTLENKNIFSPMVLQNPHTPTASEEPQ